MHEQSYGNERRVKSCDDRLAVFVDRQKKEISPGNGLRFQFFDTLLSTLDKNPIIARASDWVSTLGGEHIGVYLLYGHP
eukprot:1981894-Prorocentrum_lima.AAC.1